ncbi:transcriptional activator NhaR [Propionivibrio dicarboxylicus]|uniref:Transcriptional regulator, LysR family n=1 Tax=Propionivibrio dicarboxylicus TaxID=83767 RepID=A0A1G8JZG0_9RHOO|nr:transcriptional activator NhaR [Propionivibrio dicarboxylicus]SDI36497.1 transcriptional regulator, LysR family [Propionivibrio dicarboxylicus]
MSALNYKHLYYFWMVAKSGGISRAGERLHLTPQTVSGQITYFEDVLGYKLFDRVGHRLDLSESGRVVFDYADRIFSIGEELQEIIDQPTAGRPPSFRVGVSDAVPKSIAYRLLEPAVRMKNPPFIQCQEGKLSTLLAELAILNQDIVIADSPIPQNLGIRGFSHLLGESPMSFFASKKLAGKLKGEFPSCMDGAPMLLPGKDAAVRAHLLRWFEKQAVRPRSVGEFDDGALLKAFGKVGVGIFAAPLVIATEVCQQYGVVEIGRTGDVVEQFFAISVERRLTHPAVKAIISAARRELFAGLG